MVKIAPSAYVDDDGALHISIPELLAALRLPDTPESREQIKRHVAEVARDHAIAYRASDLRLTL